jgi:hypothetical protein
MTMITGHVMNSLSSISTFVGIRSSVIIRSYLANLRAFSETAGRGLSRSWELLEAER